MTLDATLEHLLERTGRDPLVRQTAGREVVGTWACGDAVAYLTAGDPPRLVVLGPPAGMLEQIRPQVPRPVRLSVERPWRDTLPPRWAGAQWSEWDFWWTATPPSWQPGEERVRPLTDAEAERLLDEANPTTAARPGDPRVRRWVGLVDGGQPVALAADTSSAPGVGHLSAVGTHPARRGEGLAGAVCGWLTRDLLTRCDVVTLGMYAANAPARRLYTRLGFQVGHELASTRLD